MTRIPLVDLKAEYQVLRSAGLEQAILDNLSGAHYIDGPEVEAFEREFADYCGTTESIATDSGTSALHLALLALGVGPSDEVVVPAHTFIATASAVAMTGATPVFVDADEGSCQMNLGQLESAIGPRCKAVICVHLYGQTLDMDRLTAICRAHDVALVEDACQAHGATYRGKRAGSFGAFGCFSFYPAKNLGAFGDGGAVTTGDHGAAERLRSLRNHGRLTKYEHGQIGYNYRMDAVQAVVLRCKLRYLESWNGRRRELAAMYRERLSGLPLQLPEPIGETEPVFHLFTVLLDRRDDLAAFLGEHGVDTGVHYPVPLHLQPAFRYLGYKAGAFPAAERLASRTLSLPLHPHLTDEHVDCVVQAIREFFGRR